MENWKQVVRKGVFFPGYEVSDLGQVRSCRQRVGTGKFGGTKSIVTDRSHPLSCYKKKETGYWCVSLCLEGKIVQANVACLVLEAFVGSCPQGMCCCHGPRSKDCNELTNVSWGTISKNHGEDRLRDGSDIRGEKQGQSKLTNIQVVGIKRRLANGERPTHLAREHGVSRTTIQAIKTGQNWWWIEV